MQTSEAQSLLTAAGASAAPVVDLAEAALACAVLDRGGAATLAAARAHLRDIGHAVAAEAAGGAQDPVLLAGALARILAGRFGYRGDADTYDDLANADLLSVIERRKGLPVALGVLWIHAARAAGGQAHGLAFPGHFLVAVGPGAGAAVVDPFHGGRVLGPGDLERLARSVAPQGEPAPLRLNAVPDATVLIRLQNNIKSRALSAGDTARALAVQERIVWLAPDDAEAALDLGRLSEANGRLGQARAAFTRAAELARPSSPVAAEARAAAARLTRSLH